MLALAVVLLAFAGLVYVLLARALYQQIDRTLLAGFEQLQHDDRLSRGREERLQYWIDELKEHENLFCIVYDQEGKVYQRTHELATESVLPPPVAATAEPRFYDVTVPILGRQRLLSVRVRLGDQEYPVLLMTSLVEVDRELRQVLVALVMAVPAVLVLSGGIGYFLARKALAPVDELRCRTENITAERLNQRLPILNPHDELGRLGQTINDMIGRLERSFTEIRRFTADASHELRTPLTAIRTEAEVALSKPLTLDDHQQLLGSILEECDRLTRLTGQLLTLARDDAGRVRQSQDHVDLTSLVQNVADTVRPLAEAKGLDFLLSAEESLHVLGDGAHLRQVFYNLLDNAIKYTPGKGKVEIRIWREPERVLVTVSDTGIGIAAEHLPRIFDRFYRVDGARTRAQGGTGLGLSIAQSIVVAHGGSIEMTSNLGHGTTCVVALPIKS
jgi:heavy metal sensor kinase